MSGPVPTPNGKPSKGRDVRFVVGGLCLLVNGYMVWAKAHEVPHVPLTTQDLILHLMFFGAALLLMDPVRALEVLAAVKDKIPLIGGKGGG